MEKPPEIDSSDPSSHNEAIEPIPDETPAAIKEEKTEAPAAVPTTEAPPTFPEGSTKGWLAVVGSFCIMFVTFGYINAFGVYQAYYQDTFLRHKSPSDISWIGSLQVLFQFSAGLISGPLADRYGVKYVLAPCSVVYVFAIMMTSLCREYYQFMLAQGLLAGAANGMLYTPSVAVLGHYFRRRRPLVMSIAAAGSSLGGVIFPLALERLLYHSSVGFGWAVRVMGFIVLFLCSIACCTIYPRMKPRTGPHFLGEAFLIPAYTLQLVGMFLVYFGLLFPFFYIADYAQSIGLSVEWSFYLIAIANGLSFFGRLLAGYVARYVRTFLVLSFCCAICSILIFCWLAISTRGGLIAFVVLYGFFSGGVIALFPATTAQTAPHPSKIGTYLGMAMGVYSISGLTGNPISGALVNNQGYHAAFIWNGVIVIAGAAFVFVADFFDRERKDRK